MKKFKEFILNIFAILFQCIAISILFIVVKIKFRVKINKNGYKLPKEPSIYLSNHQTNWDPLFYRCLIPKRIFFLAHDELFKTKFMSWVFTNLFDTRKRGANKNDIGAIKQLMTLKKQKRNIGIFPEGGIPYWPETNEIEPNIAKLCKKLDMPIVLHKLYGASFFYPRYHHPNKARVRPLIDRQRVITREELQKLSVEELTKIINECLYVNDYEMQSERKIALNRKKPAEHLDEGLFYCPHCKKFNTITTQDNIIKCTECGFENEVNNYGLFTAKDEKYKYFENPIEWNHSQTEYLKEYLYNYTDLENPIIAKYSAYVKYGEATANYLDIEEQQGSIEVYKDYILLILGLETIKINYADILRCYVEFRSTLELKTSTFKFRLVDDDTIWSPYQFAKTINILKAFKDAKVNTQINP